MSENVLHETTCSCVLCERPQYGVPGIAHCAACCAGSLIEEYNHNCPIAEHRAMAIRQFVPVAQAAVVES